MYNDESISYANHALAQLLSGDNNGASRTLANAPETARISYLKAIIAARTAKTSVMYENLTKAIKKDEAFKTLAATDMEFAKYFDDQNFKLILN